MMRFSLRVGPILLFLASMSLMPIAGYSAKSLDHRTYYKPYELRGLEGRNEYGFQEIRVRSDIFFVAAFGRKKADAVSEIWETRSAELCKKQGAYYFVKLRYLIEPVLQGDPSVVLPPEKQGGLVHAAGYDPYILLFANPPSGPFYRNIPNMQAHVRCVFDPTKILDPSRLIRIKPILDRAIKYKWIKEE